MILSNSIRHIRAFAVMFMLLTGIFSIAAGIRRDIWEPYGGNRIRYPEKLMEQFKNSSRAPDRTDIVGKFEVPNRAGKADYAQRLYGFLVPPVTGEYVFMVSGDDHGSLFLSSDESPEKAVRIAYSGNWPPFHDFDKYPSQKSNPVKLKKGKRYYIEASMMNTSGPGYISIAWMKPGDKEPEIIPGKYLELSPLAVYDIVEKRSPKEFSTAGFYQLKGASDRKVFNCNPGWRFIKKDVPGAFKKDFDDSGWEIVNLPHTLELLPENANGSYYYHGPAWYRKHFKLNPELRGRKLYIYFEGVMKKCTVWVNGKKLKYHEGGFLSFIIDITDDAEFGSENVVAVLADNSDDPTFPIGRKESQLDFGYFGGIYRDVWMIAANKVHVSDPLIVTKEADGGIFVYSENVSSEKADVVIKTNIQNESPETCEGVLVTELKTTDGKTVAKIEAPFMAPSASNKTVLQRVTVKNPALWSPDSPRLYYADTYIRKGSKALDALRTRFGIRSVALKGNKLYVNGKEYPYLYGGNRHQDMAYVGFAVPNSGQYRDAKGLREAALRIFRSHYPQDPAFMDGCDEFGIFAIISAPGWWYYTNEYNFPEKWMQNVRDMVRLNRNRPSCLIWEIALNETFCPEKWILKAHKIVHTEYPLPSCYTAQDIPYTFHNGYYGKDYRRIPRPTGTRSYPTDVSWDSRDRKDWMGRLWKYDGRPSFARESGDYLDGGGNHLGRGIRADGEHSLFLQSRFYEKWWNTPTRNFGKALWCAIDAYSGARNFGSPMGVLDYYRFPKTSFALFKSQNDPNLKIPGAETGPMVFIAHYLTAFSPEDVVVYTNCDKVRLTLPKGIGKSRIIEGVPDREKYKKMPHPPVVFKKLFNWSKDKQKWAPPSLSKKIPGCGTIKAEGIINGKVVATDIRKTAAYACALKMELDDAGLPLVADGGDFVIVRCYMVDSSGSWKVLAHNQVYFEVEGEGVIVGDEGIQANPFNAEFGSAAVYIRSTTKPGTIKITAKTCNMGRGSISLKSVAPSLPLLWKKEAPSKKLKAKKRKRSEQIKGYAADKFSKEDFERQLKVTPK